MSQNQWTNFGKAVLSQRGRIIEAAGQVAKGEGYATGMELLSSELGLEAISQQMLANWAEMGLDFASLQGTLIDIQTAIQRRKSTEKWIGRHQSTKARYAARNISVRVGTPVSV
ncbi:MAG: hypothetical protein ACYTBZ_29160, partial [Planctomycetota bacterium]